jgi:hypothetical protein
MSLMTPIATIDAWEKEFKGNAAETLLDTISVYLAQSQVYSHHANILNSSGTGKSRLVDELAKTIITVPICLRHEGSHDSIRDHSLRLLPVHHASGYPLNPPDKEIRDWFLSHKYHGQKEAAECLRRFLYALLRVTLKRLRLLEGRVVSYSHSDQNLTAVRISQGRWTPSCVRT